MTQRPAASASRRTVPPNQYGAPPYGGFAAPDHQQAVLVLILGILGLVLCQVISPFAWVMGNRVVAEIDASNGQLGGRSTANAGRICGIVGTFLLGSGAADHRCRRGHPADRSRQRGVSRSPSTALQPKGRFSAGQQYRRVGSDPETLPNATKPPRQPCG